MFILTKDIPSIYLEAPCKKNLVFTSDISFSMHIRIV